MLGMLPKRSVGAEIGVFQGEFARGVIRIVGPQRLHFIDSWWLQLGEHYLDYGAYTDFGRLSTRKAYDRACRIVVAHAGPNACQSHVPDDIECLSTLPAC
jgi:hypothetical protein